MVTELRGLFDDILFNSSPCEKNGAICSISPGSKLFFLVLAILSISICNSVYLLAVLYLVCLALVSFSGIGLGFFLKRSLFLVPLFGILPAIPSIFDLFVPGDSAMVIFASEKEWPSVLAFLPSALSVTQQGLSLASVLILRVVDSISYLLLVRFTTDPEALLASITGLAPRWVSFASGLSYRYMKTLFLTIDEIEFARTSRGFFFGSSHYRQSLADSAYMVLKKSLSTAEKISDSMKARGFDGNLRALGGKKSRGKDLIPVLLGAVLLLTAVLWR